VSDRPKQKLIVLGTGFSAFSLLKSLKRNAFDTTVISPRNHFLFTPLLPSTTVGTLEFRSIIEPIRRGIPGVDYIQARCTEVDSMRRVITCEGSLDGTKFQLTYDTLVIAVGAINNTFNIPGVEQHALFLKELLDARTIRERIIDCFERASQPFIPAERRAQLLHFVVVGGGPTGVEFAAEMHDFIREDLRKAYSSLVADARITILEAGSSILSTFDGVLSNYTAKLFRRQGIDVRTNSPVVQVAAELITLKNGDVVPFGLLVWSTGIGPTSLVQSLSMPKSKTHKLVTDEWFRVKGIDKVYAVGDCAAFASVELPATSQVAQQEIPRENTGVHTFMQEHSAISLSPLRDVGICRQQPGAR